MDKTYFQNAKKQMAEFKETMKKNGRKFFSEQSKELFDKHPTLVKFGWIQYTPYWNDGEPCEFSAQLESPHMLLVGQDDEVYEEEAWFPDDAEITDESIAFRAIIEFLSQFDDEDVEILFGDHCQVTVTEDGVEVEEYEHD